MSRASSAAACSSSGSAPGDGPAGTTRRAALGPVEALALVKPALLPVVEHDDEVLTEVGPELGGPRDPPAVVAGAPYELGVLQPLPPHGRHGGDISRAGCRAEPVRKRQVGAEAVV